MTQERIAIKDLKNYLEERVSMSVLLKKI
jgi:hypothetical protein